VTAIYLTGTLRWYTIAKGINDAVYNGLTTKPRRSGVVPGAIAWDECSCDGGMLATSVAAVYPSEEPFNQQEEFPTNCYAPYEVARIIVQVIRCAPQMDAQGNPPSVAALDASAQTLIQDSAEMINAALTQLCTWETGYDISAFLVSPVEPQGPEGDCVGNEMTVRVAMIR
jgi:hypothetical protein